MCRATWRGSERPDVSTRLPDVKAHPVSSSVWGLAASLLVCVTCRGWVGAQCAFHFVSVQVLSVNLTFTPTENQSLPPRVPALSVVCGPLHDRWLI